ncbi:dephospho-CoA kinase [Candidatus Woesearchaeota archaeon]|nr:dephospho-CoA kinase [Candidatus Woesearchaeota archaeon]
MIVAVTGNICSGKTTAAKEIAKAGFMHINADTIGHSIYNKPDIRKKIVAAFGSHVLSGKNVDRKKLRREALKSTLRLRRLSTIMHPAILESIKGSIKGGNVIIDAALIIEAGWTLHDVLILVTASKAERISRLQRKGRYNKAEIITLLKMQMPDKDKVRHADIVVDNSGKKSEFIANIRKIAGELKCKT